MKYYCRFCNKECKNEPHIIGIVADEENPYCCDDCWDERLR